MLLRDAMKLDPKLAADYRFHMKLPMMIQIIEQLKKDCNPLRTNPNTADAGAIGISLGIIQGQQDAISKIGSMFEAVHTPMEDEDFLTGPTTGDE